MARYIRLSGEEAIFAPAPFLEALCTVLSAAATNGKCTKRHNRDPLFEQRAQISFIDVSRHTSMQIETRTWIRCMLTSPGEPQTRLATKSGCSLYKPTETEQRQTAGMANAPAYWES